MPTVTARYGGTKVGRRPVPGVRKQAHETAQSTGANLAREQADTGRVIGQVGTQIFGYAAGEIDKAIKKERHRANSVAMMEAENRGATWKTNRLYGKGGAYEQRGKNAMGLPEQLRDEWAKVSGEIAAGLSTDEQRLAWHEYSLRMGADLDLTIQQHVDKERNAYEAGELDAKLKNNVQDTAAVANDPRRARDLGRTVATVLHDGLSRIAQHGENLGFGPERIEQMSTTFENAVHESVIDGLINSKQISKARTYLEEAGAHLDEQAKERLTKKLEVESITEEKQKSVEEIIAQAPNDIEKQLKLARETLSGELEEKVTDELKVRQVEAVNQARLKREAIGIRGKNIIEAGGSYDDIPDRDLLDVSESWQLQQYEINRRKSGGSGYPEHSDPNTYSWLTMMAKSPDPNMRLQFQQMSLMSVLGRLSESDQKHFENLQADTRRGDVEKAEARLRNPAFQVDMVNQALGKMGFDPTPAAPGAEKYDQQMAYNVAEFRRAVREAAQRKEAQTGKDITDDELQSIVDQLSIPMGQRRVASTRFGGLLGSSAFVPAFAYQVPQAQISHTRDIPPSERQRLINELTTSDAAKKPGFAMPTGDALERILLRLFNEHLAITRKDR